MKKTLIIAGIALMGILSSCGGGKQTFSEDFRDWAPTPPMGWNSWDCYGPTVVESEVKANADYMAENLLKYGWEYVIVDIRWFVANDKAGGYNQTDPIYSLDEWGRYTPAVNRFPSAADGKGFKPLADYIHGKGLKFGIHLMRGISKVAVENKMPIKGTDGITADMIYNDDRLCWWLRDNKSVDASKAGAQEYYNSLFDLYASWGVDYVKIDDLSSPYHLEEIELIRHAIDQCGRPIVLSTSPGPTPVDRAEHLENNANMWRMVNDVWDIWGDVTNLMDVAQGWYDHIGGGTWPDCDMIPLGRLSIRGERGEDRPTRLTPDEQKSLMTFFCIFRSPLMFGGDLPSMDDFTLSLLTDETLLKLNRYGENVHQVLKDDSQLIVASTVEGKTYHALFNIGEEEQTITVPGTELSATLAPHACTIL